MNIYLFLHKKNTEERVKSKEGFILVFAIFLSTIVLTITLSMMNTLYKGLLLSATDRESQKAFFAADIGMECAMYYDLGAQYGADASSSASIFLFENKVAAGIPIMCANRDITTEKNFADTLGSNYIILNRSTGGAASDINQDTDATFFVRNIGAAAGSPYDKTLPCAQVVVTKLRGVRATTSVDSHGFNHCDESDLRRVERAIEFGY